MESQPETLKIRISSPATTVMLDATTSVTDSPTKACVNSFTFQEAMEAAMKCNYVSTNCGACVRGVRRLTVLQLQDRWRSMLDESCKNRSKRLQARLTKAYCVARLPQQRKMPPPSAKPTEGPLFCSKHDTYTQTWGVQRDGTQCSTTNASAYENLM